MNKELAERVARMLAAIVLEGEGVEDDRDAERRLAEAILAAAQRWLDFGEQAH
jgi:hypothetical protein